MIDASDVYVRECGSGWILGPRLQDGSTCSKDLDGDGLGTVVGVGQPGIVLETF